MSEQSSVTSISCVTPARPPASSSTSSTVMPDRVERAQRGPELVEVPVVGVPVAGRGGDVAGDDVVQEVPDLLVQVGAVEHLATLGVDDLALAVQHVVVLQDVLADLEVLRLDLALRRLDRAGDDLGLERHVVADAGGRHEAVDHAGVEQPHQVVLHRQVEPALARVALPAGTAAQLVVDPPRLVPLGAEHVEPAGLDDLIVLCRNGFRRLLERVAPGRFVLLGRSRPGPGPRACSSATAMNSALPPSMMSVPRPAMLVATVTAPLRPAWATISASRACSLAFSTLGRTPRFLSSAGEVLALLDAHGADEDRLARPRALDDVVDDRAELGVLGAVDQVGLVGPDHRPVGRDRARRRACRSGGTPTASVIAVPVIPASLSYIRK